jgi:hypothetical protein
VLIPDLRPDPKPNPTVRCGRVASPAHPRLPSVGPLAEAVSGPYKAAALHASFPFCPGTLACALRRRHRTLARRRRLRPPAPPLFSR